MQYDIPIHPESKRLLDTFIASPSHAVILTSASGVVLQKSTDFIASALLHIDIDTLADNPAILRLPKDNTSVSIEDIRDIQKFIKLKTLGTKNIRRVVAISALNKMSNESQNALLKVLEEPPVDTLLIVATHTYESLLPTIRSRAQAIHLNIPTLDQYKTMYSGNPDDTEKAFYMSGGHPEAMEGLLLNKSSDITADLDLAKQILSADPYQRLLLVEPISKNKTATQTLTALENMCHAALKQSARKNAASTKQWAIRLKHTLKAEQDLTYNVSSKIVLTDLFLKI